MKVTPEVLTVLERLRFEGPQAFITGGQLDPKLYKAVNKVLVACGGKWTTKKKAHVFDGDAASRIEVVLTTGEVTTDQDLGFFPTSPELAEELVSLADVRPGMRCLEPSAGEGAIVDALLATGADPVIAIERDPARRAKLSRAHVDELQVIRPGGAAVDLDDFLDYHITSGPNGTPFDTLIDRVVMNPPFIKVGLGDHIDHVRHAYGLLAAGGVLVSVMPASIRFRQDRRHREFSEWIASRGDVADLPEDSFKESGTRVRTCTVRLVK